MLTYRSVYFHVCVRLRGGEGAMHEHNCVWVCITQEGKKDTRKGKDVRVRVVQCCYFSPFITMLIFISLAKQLLHVHARTHTPTGSHWQQP